MYKLSEAAARDIEIVLQRSVIDFGLTQTEHYYNSLKNRLELLAGNPEMGNVAADIQPGYRCFSHQSHIIFIRLQTVIFLLYVFYIKAWTSLNISMSELKLLFIGIGPTNFFISAY